MFSAALLATVAFGSMPFASGVASAASAPIKLGFINSVTGDGAAARANAPAALEARVKWQNAHGGINGRQIQLITRDDQSSPTGNLTAAKSLISAGVVAIVESTNLDNGGAPYLSSQGIAVGETTSGPTCAQDRDWFCDTGSFSLKYPAISTWGEMLKSKGATVMAALGYGSFPSAALTATSQAASARSVGISTPYVNSSLPFPEPDFGPICSAMKADHVDSVAAELITSDVLSLVSACQQIGLMFKAEIFPTVFDPTSLGHNLANTELQGVEAYAGFVPAIVKSNAGVNVMLKAFKQYGVGYPGYSAEGGWLTADEIIYGMEHAGSHVTKQSILHALQNTTHYTGGGLEITPVNFKSGFGKGVTTVGPAPGYCVYVMTLKGQTFSLVHKTPVCGKVIAG
jgi:branched-chain amino acid transport system substrate-binding protein